MHKKRILSFFEIFIGLVLFIVFSEGLSFAGNPNNTYAIALQHFVDSGKLPPAIQKKIGETGQSGILLILDDSDVKALAKQMRETRGLKYDDNAIIAEKARHFNNRKNTVFSRLSRGNYTLLRDYDNFPVVYMEVDENALAGLMNMPEVSYVAENKLVIPYLTESLPLIRAPQAHAAGATGAGTAVAILDTGVHYTLAAFGNCTAPGVPSGTCKVAYEACFATGGCQANNDHGTNVSGIVVGVAPDTKILGLDVFRTDGNAYYSDIISALNWAINNKATYNIVAVSMSFGDGEAYTAPCGSDGLASILHNVKSAGISPVAASGNDGFINAIGAPACTPDAISVGAVYDSNMGSIYWSNCTDLSTAADKVTCFSNSSSLLTLLAPGALITAANITMGGTSQATPHVSGAVALMKGQNNTLSVDQVISGLTSTGVPVTDPRNNITKPRVDLYSIVSITNPIIGVAPSSFNFMAAAGGLNPVAQTLNITNTGAGNLSWSVSSSATWLTVSPSSGTAPGSVTLSVNTTGLTKGIYNTNITTNSTGSLMALNTPVTIPVTLQLIDSAYSEDFESLILTHKFPWVTAGDGAWAVQSSTVHTGSYAAQSPAMGDGQTSTLSVTLDVTSPGYVSFWLKTSTEAPWDKMRFYVDGVNEGPLNGWSGTTDWTFAGSEHQVSVGTHTFTWEYSKDGSVSLGSDAVWLDDIFFPPHVIHPVANFSGSPISGDAPLAVSFTDLTSPAPTSWSWDFGDGSTGTEQNPLHNYKTPGTYTVNLSATNSGGTASLTQTGYITVSACSNQPVRIAGATPVYYPTVQTAYNAAADGNAIEAHALDFAEGLNFNHNVQVTLRGGYDCDYALNPSQSTVQGSLTVNNGMVVVENIAIQ